MSRQMSETLRVGMILAVSGGFMDAYSYLFRGISISLSGGGFYDRDHSFRYFAISDGWTAEQPALETMFPADRGSPAPCRGIYSLPL